MGPAKFFSALVGLGVILTAGAQSPAAENCGPCSKILDPVCGIDGEDETKTFPSRCVMRWCNCMLRAADSDRSFSVLKSGYCAGDSSDETAIPECFPELEATDESAGVYGGGCEPASACAPVHAAQAAGTLLPLVVEVSQARRRAHLSLVAMDQQLRRMVGTDLQVVRRRMQENFSRLKLAFIQTL